MNSNRLFAVALVVAALAFAAPTAISQTDKDDDAGFRARMPRGQAFMTGPPGRFVHMRMLRALDLTEDQRQQIWEFQSA